MPHTPLTTIRKTRKVGLFGGSFNPPTIAHLALAQHAYRALELDELWWLVAPHNPNKPKHTLAPFEHRLAMSRLVAHDRPWLHVSDLEAQLGTQQTADTLRSIIARYPDLDFVWLMGTDNLVHFHQWDDWQDILQMMPIAIFTRPDELDIALAAPSVQIMEEPHPAHHAKSLQPGQWAILDNDHMPVSATKVRERLANGEATDYILPIVADYIQQNKLYQSR